MIHEIGVELAAALAAQGCPLKVIDGPEPTDTTTFGRERIVIEHDDGDTFAAPQTQGRNPRIRFVRNIAVQIKIYAQVASTGATHWEHRRRAEHILDLVLVALEKVILARKNLFALTGGGFFLPPDLEASEIIGGAAYKLTFWVNRAVMVQTWAGDPRPQVALAVVAMTGTPTLTFDGTAHTVTRSSGSWLTDGFLVGMPVNVTKAVNSANDVTQSPITALTDLVMTFASGLVDEGPTSGCAVVAGGITSTTQVSLYKGPSGQMPEVGCGA
jgi:hypothetical protein